VLLIAGVFAMLYVRERRLWIWLQAEQPLRTRALLALGATRRTLDADAEFDRLKRAVLKEGNA
jgi:cytochrome c biogenesis protein